MAPLSGYQLIAMDCRGHGQSGKPHDPAAYGLGMVNDIVRLLDYLEIERAHLVGFSMGAEIALKAAARYPERVRSAVLAGDSWSDDSVYELMRMLRNPSNAARGYALTLMATPPGQTRTAEEIEAFEQWNQAMLARNDAHAQAALCRNYSELEELRVTEEEVRALQVRILGVAGEHDPTGRPMLERMQGVAPDFTLIVLEGLGHGGPAFFEALTREATSFFQRIRPQ